MTDPYSTDRQAHRPDSGRTSKLAWFSKLRGVDLSHTEFRVLTVLMTYTNADGTNAHPGVARLARDCQMTERSIQRILRALEDKRAITITQVGGNQNWKGCATVYRVNTPKGDTVSNKGDGTSGARVIPLSPHQVITPVHQHHSESSDSGAPQAAPRYEDSIEGIEDWYHDTTGSHIDGPAFSTALGMYESGSPFRAIQNKIAKDYL